MRLRSSHVFKSTLGNAFISASGFLTSVVILKFFGSDDFAHYVYLFAVVQILATFISLRLEQYISTVNGDNKEFSRAVEIIVLLSAVVALLGAAANALGILQSNFSESLFYIVICASSIALSNLSQNFLIANHDFGRLTNLRLYFALAQPAFLVGLGYFFANSVEGILVGLALANSVITAFAMKKFYVLDLGIQNIIKTLIQSRKFTTISLVADLFSVFAGNILVVYLNGKLSSEIYVALVVFQRFVVAPLGMMSRIFFDVFKSELARADRSKFYTISRLFTVKMSLMGTGIIAVMFLATYVLGYIQSFDKVLIDNLLTVMITMLPVLVLRFAVSSTSYVLYFIKKQEVDLFWQVLNFGLILAGMGLIENSILGYSLAASLSYIVYIMLILKVLK